MHDGQGDPLPARAALHASGLYLQLRDIGVAELHDPFLKETIARCAAPERYVQVSMADLGRASAASAPAGLVFHVARCGSTLVSQLLKQQDELVVYAEPPAVNEILRPPQHWQRHELLGALRSLGDALARHARRPYVIKCTSWNTLYCELLAEAFPDTPWVLCLRNPVEVCVSLLQRPPGWLPGTGETSRRFAALIDPQGRSTTNETLVARTFGAFCEAIARLDRRRGRLVEYPALPAAVWQQIAPHFAVPVGEAARGRMEEAALRQAKAPVDKAAPFTSDAASKQAAASATLRAAIAMHARPALERLRAAFGLSGTAGEP